MVYWSCCASPFRRYSHSPLVSSGRSAHVAPSEDVDVATQHTRNDRSDLHRSTRDPGLLIDRRLSSSRSPAPTALGHPIGVGGNIDMAGIRQRSADRHTTKHTPTKLTPKAKESRPHISTPLRHRSRSRERDRDEPRVRKRRAESDPNRPHTHKRRRTRSESPHRHTATHTTPVAESHGPTLRGPSPSSVGQLSRLRHSSARMESYLMALLTHNPTIPIERQMEDALADEEEYHTGMAYKQIKLTPVKVRMTQTG